MPRSRSRADTLILTLANGAVSSLVTPNAFVNLDQGGVLRHVSVYLGQDSAPVMVNINLVQGGNPIPLASGWVRGNGAMGEFDALVWDGEILLPRDPILSIIVRNDNGAEATITWSWFVES